MFRKSEPVRRRSSFLPLTIFRLLLSIVILGVFALGIYQAFRYFSGLDPLKLDPGALAGALLSTEGIAQPLARYTGFTMPDGNQPLKSLSEKLPKEEPRTEKPSGEPIFKFAVVADSHNDNDNLAKALAQAKSAGVKFVIGLGDYSKVGTMVELEAARRIFAVGGLPYYSTAGDHDLWDSRDKGWLALKNYNQVFGAAYQTFVDSNIRFVIVYNSDNYQGLGELQMEWLKTTLKQSATPVFLFVHEPLYHPTSDRFMGKTNPQLAEEAKQIRDLAKEAGVKLVIAGDIHAFTEYSDPDSGLKMVTAGALEKERNVQTPRFLMVDVYSGGRYNIQDTEVK